MSERIRRVSMAVLGMLLAPVASAAGESSLHVDGLLSIAEHCGAGQAKEETFQLVGEHACPGPGGGELLAYEEHQLFLYALAKIPGGHRRFLLLKPATLVVEDLLVPGVEDRPLAWILESPVELAAEGLHFRALRGDRELLGETLLPEDARYMLTERAGSEGEAGTQRLSVSSGSGRFLHLLHARPLSNPEAMVQSEMKHADRRVDLTVTAGKRTYRLFLHATPSRAGEIEVVAANGRTMLERRMLPSGIMPHGPEGVAMLKDWDSDYHKGRTPGWDTGRPASHLVEAIESGSIEPGRAIVFGCGTGTNAIYLASKGFEVTGVDVAPTALMRAQWKAHKAGEKVRFLMSDVLALPELEPFDLIFDRGCYHHICQYDSPGYVKSVLQVSHPGTRFLLLAGCAKEKRPGGPPKIKRATIENDFSELFDFEWFREVRLDTQEPKRKGTLSWWVNMVRKGE